MGKRLIIGLGLVSFLGLAAQLALSDDDYESRDEGGWSRVLKRKPDVAAVNNTRYQTECSSCHMAYPAGLLPARSWEKIMSGLSDHFGDNAELDAQTTMELTRYLVDNSADKSNYRRSRQIMRSLTPEAVPLRISEVPYIRNKHDEIPPRLIRGNAKVGSLSNCSACHQNAQQGSFREAEINIPGYGRWED